jgi:adenylylsulfate kinase
LYELRTIAIEIIGTTDFLEIFVNAPLAVCEERDVKGM